jgi:hypothetical protein
MKVSCAVAALALGCHPGAPAHTITLQAPSPSAPVPSIAVPRPRGDEIDVRARTAVVALRAKDMAAFATLVDPREGVRFSPYSYVDASDVRLTAVELTTALTDKTVRHWGSFDGSGAPIDLTFAKYYARFVFDVDFTRGTKPPEDFGENTVNNAEAFYGDTARIVELYIAPHNSDAMDWHMLRIVLKPSGVERVYYVVGIIHAEWTI